MKKIKEKFQSIRVKLFLIISIIIFIVIMFLILANNILLEHFYLYTKSKNILAIYYNINNYYEEKQTDSTGIKLELEKQSINNNYDIVINNAEDETVYSSVKEFSSYEDYLMLSATSSNVLYEKDNIYITKIEDKSTNITYLFFQAKLCNDYNLYITMPFDSIKQSIEISNRCLCFMGIFTILIAGIVVSFVSKKFTEPIIELDAIADKMAHLDFSHKYFVTSDNDEINELGRSINIMSDKLENTIKQLRQSNIELEKDIEKKSKIDEMRKQFISDVSHELKTPIGLIRGYAEGLIENVNTDDEGRKYYAEVILDESNKMERLVYQLLQLMKLEYGKSEFNDQAFDICEVITETIRRTKMVVNEYNIEVKFDYKEPVFVYADDFYIEQVVTNYFTNAIKQAQTVNGKKMIQVYVEKFEESNKVRISVYNTGKQLSEETMARIWNRFYKEDESRNRANGGTGIGLSIVKAIMNNYKQDYGVVNKDDGVEFYFELEMANEDEDIDIE
jgi:signal transduction histidine kinase